jgi:hypothetical protein
MEVGQGPNWGCSAKGKKNDNGEPSMTRRNSDVLMHITNDVKNNPFTFILRRSALYIFLPLPSLMSISVHSIHPRLIIWFLNNLVFTV